MLREQSSGFATHQGMWQEVSRAAIKSSFEANSEMMTPRGRGNRVVTATCTLPLHRSAISEGSNLRRRFGTDVSALSSRNRAQRSEQKLNYCENEPSHNVYSQVIRYTSNQHRDWDKAHSSRKVCRTLRRRPRVPPARQSSQSTKHASITVCMGSPLW